MDVPIVSHPDWMRSTCHTAIGTLDGSYTTLIIFLTIQMLLASFAFLRLTLSAALIALQHSRPKNRYVCIRRSRSKKAPRCVRLRELWSTLPGMVHQLVLFWTANYRFGYRCKQLWTLLSNIFLAALGIHSLTQLTACVNTVLTKLESSPCSEIQKDYKACLAKGLRVPCKPIKEQLEECAAKHLGRLD